MTTPPPLTPEQLRDLNRAVHTHVMGNGPVCECERGPNGFSIHGYDPDDGRCNECDRGEPRSYATDIAAAWSVVEKMRADGWGYEIGAPCYNAPSVFQGCNFYRWNPDTDNDWQEFEESRKEIPLAICLAALKAVGKAYGEKS